jgi:hypothetical protein
VRGDSKGASVRIVYAIAAALCSCVQISTATEAGQLRSKVPVLIGGEESSEGCAGTAVVDVGERSTLALRSGPATTHPAIAQLRRGQSVSVCQRRKNGWVGIVVHRSGEDRDCGLSDAGPKAKAYAGPCHSGWVLERYLRLQAG